MQFKKFPFPSMHVDVEDFIPATDEEKEYLVQMRPSSTFFKDGMKRLLKNKLATLSLFIVVVITLSAIFLPMFYPYSYEQQLGITPGKPVDASFKNLAPFEYGETEQERMERIQAERAKKTLTVKIPEEITVGDLANLLRRTAAEVIKEMFKLGVMASVNQTIDFDTAEIVATELGAKVEK